ncbi:MAG TPA: tRNA (uridine(34)/cytosine(34)/5-carboxymethylaminomethyluridine(34)-2'-O)-methyltransferase TrmL [Deltaproteobacteria bacterium]|nr:tRNA (uridine(34)/cytosine(34)/5-carboxymethylaminomethyluridine(34)-2'-O)-methyltransferase TrmL [Deltaproteobacteria bacterium]
MQIALIHPQIPPNTGNIARLCVATETPLHLVHPLGFSTDAAQLRRAGLDYWKYLKLEEHSDWRTFLEHFAGRRMFFYTKKATKPYTAVEYREEDFLVFGSETEGLPREIHERFADRLLTIPMWGPTRSLNLATSAGIVLYEALRQVKGAFL